MTVTHAAERELAMKNEPQTTSYMAVAFIIGATVGTFLFGAPLELTEWQHIVVNRGFAEYRANDGELVWKQDGTQVRGWFHLDQTDK